MPEGMNVEISHKLSEQEEKEKRKARWEVLVEIVEVAVLAIVAVATAWSGYQAARWDGQQSLQLRACQHRPVRGRRGVHLWRPGACRRLRHVHRVLAGPIRRQQ